MVCQLLRWPNVSDVRVKNGYSAKPVLPFHRHNIGGTGGYLPHRPAQKHAQYKVGFGIVVDFLEIHIPKNTFFKYGFWFFHAAKSRISVNLTT